MKFVACLVLFLFFSNSFSQNISPQFSELKGMKDQSANTHLFYRIYSSTQANEIYDRRNDIYHFDLNNNIDSLFLMDYGHEDPAWTFHISVGDYDFWNFDFTKFIFGGTVGDFEPAPYIQRFDSDPIYFQALFGSVESIGISYQNDSLLYVGAYLEDFSSYPNESLKSTDGGWNWYSISDSLKFVSLYPFDDDLLFLLNSNGFLFKSSDGGTAYNIVDTSVSFIWNDFRYDKNMVHIYRIAFDYPYTTFTVSDNKGEPFSWEIKNQYDSQIQISLDDSISGTIYLANKKNIYLSTDYGDNFNLYKTLDRKIVGIYKKPNSNKLYAATKCKIYEITHDSIHIIKSLPIPDEVLNYYPLAVGNKWIYDKYTHIEWNTYHDIFIRTVVGDSLLPNGKKYFHLFEDVVGSYNQTYFERVDSSEGKVYRYDNTQGFPDDEYIIDDLLAEIGDTIPSYRMGYWEDGYTTMIDEVTFEKWGLIKPKKVFEQYILHPPVYSLTQDIGLDSIYSYFDFGETRVIIKGCIINGSVYGDTTVVSIEGVTPNLPTEFSLSQNYPNPFNPTTTIKFTISDLRFTILKVYDVLGNEIATLVNEEKSSGEYEVEFSGKGLPSGVYFYQLRTGGFVDTKKLILIK